MLACHWAPEEDLSVVYVSPRKEFSYHSQWLFPLHLRTKPMEIWVGKGKDYREGLCPGRHTNLLLSAALLPRRVFLQTCVLRDRERVELWATCKWRATVWNTLPWPPTRS